MALIIDNETVFENGAFKKRMKERVEAVKQEAAKVQEIASEPVAEAAPAPAETTTIEAEVSKRSKRGRKSAK